MNSKFTRIMAGPGTGKTTALMSRIKELLNGGVNPKKILLVTFTRTSAADLKEELNNLGVPNSDKIGSGTLHSFCLEVLRSEHFFEQTGRVPRILLEFETRFLLEDLPGKFWDLKKQMGAFEAGWAREQDQQAGWAEREDDKKFDRELHGWLEFHRAMLLSEIVPKTLNYLRRNATTGVLESFEHVFVDEYQDFNRAEQSLIDMLCSQAHLTIAGDEDQSIYQSMKYAHPEGISQFHISHEGTVDEVKDVCRRCPKLIVEMANNLISENTLREKRQLLVKPDNVDGEVHVVQWADINAEASGIARFVVSKIDAEEFLPGRVLILCPIREFGYAIRDVLNEMKKDAHSFFREEIFDGDPKDIDECQAQEAYTLLKLVDDPYDRPALRCWLGFGHNNLRRDEYRRLREYCYNNAKHPFDALAELEAGAIPLEGNTKGIQARYRVLVERLRELEGKEASEVLKTIFPDNGNWAEEFRRMTAELGEGLSLKKAISKFQVEATRPELPKEVEYIRVMSLHGSKGLDADLVVITGFVEGLIPRHAGEDMSDHNRKRFKEEQRRLCYVAVTRTRKTLVLSSVASLPRKFKHKGAILVGGDKEKGMTSTSTFHEQLGPKCPIAVTGVKWKY